MKHQLISTSFIATNDPAANPKEVSALFLCPPKAKAIFVFGHGASSPMDHPLLETLAEHLADQEIASFRYQFPYMERGGKGRDSQKVTFATVESAIKTASTLAPELALFAGGHSFGGRMTSMTLAESPELEFKGEGEGLVKGILFFSFPLHPAGKPDVKRAEHLSQISVPLLFISGTRDKLAELELLKPVCSSLKKQASLYLVESGDHSLKVLKKAQKTQVEVFQEITKFILKWVKAKL